MDLEDPVNNGDVPAPDPEHNHVPNSNRLRLVREEEEVSAVVRRLRRRVGVSGGSNDMVWSNLTRSLIWLVSGYI